MVIKQIGWADIKNYIGKSIIVKDSKGNSRTLFVDDYKNGTVMTGGKKSSTFFNFPPENEIKSTIKIFINE